MIQMPVIACAVLVFLGAPEAKGPTISFEKADHHFGSIEQGQPVKTEFRFANRGTEPLIIEDIRTSCGCTAAALKKRTFSPGEQGVIEVKLNTSRLKGRVSKSVRVFSNDPDMPETRLRLTGEVP